MGIYQPDGEGSCANCAGNWTESVKNGKKLRHPIAYPNIENGKILSVGKLPCCGEGCYESTRKLFEKAIKHEPKKNVQEQ